MHTYAELRAAADNGLMVLVMPCVLPGGQPGVDVFGFNLFHRYRKRAVIDRGYALRLTLHVASKRRAEIARDGVTFA